jgi:flagellar motor switch protein FliN
MPEDLDYQPLEPQGEIADPASVGRGSDLRRLREVPVGLTVEIGRARMTVGETLHLRPGSIIKLDRLAEEPLDLLVNGTRIARGEVVVIDEDFGLRITEVIVAGAPVAGISAAVPAVASGEELAGLPAGGDEAEVVDGDPVGGDAAEANAA